jgi:hypothetical protein
MLTPRDYTQILTVLIACALIGAALGFIFGKLGGVQ